MSSVSTTAILRHALTLVLTVTGTAVAGPNHAATLVPDSGDGNPLEYSNAVADGDFEAGFPNPYWAVDGQDYTVDQISQLDPFSGSWSMSLGGNSEVAPYEWWASAEQTVVTDGQPWLSFWLKLPILGQPYEQAGLSVYVGATEVYTVVLDYYNPPSGVYEPVFVDLSSVVPPGPNALRFEAWGLYPQGQAGTHGGQGTSIERTQATFLVDEVILATVDTSCAQADPGGGEGKGSCLSDLYTPADTQAGLGLTPTFSWQCVDAIYSPCYGYQVLVSDQIAGPYQTACEAIGTDETSCTSTLQLQPETTYYWHVSTYECSLMGTLPVCDTAIWSFGTAPLPVADFTWSPPAPVLGELIQFDDLSTGEPTSWLWDFGDGSSSTQQNPSHTFTEPGIYDVSLTVTNILGQDTHTVQFVFPDPPVAAFTWTPPNPGIGQSVQFTDQSAGNPTSWSWSFGDGGTSAQQNPSHVFAAAGTYDVSLTVTNASGQDTSVRQVVIPAAPVADFTWAPASPGIGQVVQFTDQSTGNPTSWSWSFGDGGTSTQQNPSHVFAAAGTYDVSLTVTNASGQDTSVRQVVIPAAPVADFTWAPASPGIGQVVQFTDQSTGNPTSWSWSFGDGGTSTQQNPSHVFAAAGTYDVSLTVTNASGQDTSVRQVVIPAAPVADFTWAPASPGIGQVVQFTDQSTGNPTSWSWSFGDGGTSTQQNPSHVFAAAGTYDVSLTVTNASGQDTRVRQLVFADPLVADFSWSPPSPQVGDVVQFYDQSTGEPAAWTWDFGDGATSTEQYPTHAYGETGSYTVTLVVTNASGPDQVSRTLQVPPDGPYADFSWSPQVPQVGETVTFVDLSSGDPVVWSWDFGDGATSTEQNPLHTYADEGRYVVTLTVVGDLGSDDSTAVLVVVGASPPPGGEEIEVTAPGAVVGEQAATAVDPSGNRVMVWRQQASGLKNDHDGIFGRVFGPDDQPLGEPFEVANGAFGTLDDPSVAMDAQGNFFVGWGKSGEEPGIFGRFFTGDQTPVGESIRLDDGGSQPSRPKVAASNAGELAVVWTDNTSKSLSGDGIFARAFGADGQPKGPAVRVDPGTGGEISDPQVAADALGSFVVVWSQTAVGKGDGAGGVFGRGFGPDGQPTGDPEILNDDPTGEVKDAGVGRSPTGTTVVVWSQDRGAASGWDVFARWLDASGQAFGSQIRVNAGAEGTQERPAVAVNLAGDFAVAWESRAGKLAGGDDGIFGRFFGSGGEPLGPEFAVVVPAGGVEPRFPSAEISSNDAVTVAYTKVGPSGPQGVYFRTFSVVSAPGECDGGPTALCLNRGRFRVEVAWRDFEDSTGVGEAVALTDDTGAFWFFDAANLELAVKVLDGRLVNGHFWVFYAAMSNVEFAITVTDTMTGGSVTYSNPMGNFASVGDTEALPGDGKAFIRRTVEAPMGRFDVETAALYTQLVRARSSVKVVPQGECTPGATSLCLNQARFRVEVSWRAPDGTTGVGQAVPLTSDTGSFWFFDDANLELILKVLDGRWLNGHFWVFYGALSNVEYTITVTDTETGEQEVYVNPMGEFGSIGDTEAF